VILILGAIVAVPILMHRSNKRAYPTELKGFGGWLILFAIGVYLAPLRSLVEFAKTQQELPQIVREKFPLMVGGEIALNIAFIA
jgi:uncharacterized membrane protein YedE/YeeE